MSTFVLVLLGGLGAVILAGLLIFAALCLGAAVIQAGQDGER